MKNKEPLILAVVVAFSLVVYYLVEPFAHHQMHKHFESEGFAYKDLATPTKEGHKENGKVLAIGNYACISCHSIKAENIPAPMDPATAAQAYGVNPPDLSNAGVVYDAKFLTDLIKNPAHALMVEHKFDAAKGKVHPMAAYTGMGGDLDQEVADIVAFLQSIAVSKEKLTPTIAFEVACGRCHANHYAGWTQIGEKPAFKKKQDEYAYDAKVLDYTDALTKYMGKLPPDLSIYIRSRGEHYIKTFMENPQNYLKGTAMPRVGVTEEAAEKVIEYLEDSGDAKRHERESVGRNVMIFIIIFAIFALLWKKQVWKDLH